MLGITPRSGVRRSRPFGGRRAEITPVRVLDRSARFGVASEGHGGENDEVSGCRTAACRGSASPCSAPPSPPSGSLQPLRRAPPAASAEENRPAERRRGPVERRRRRAPPTALGDAAEPVAEPVAELCCRAPRGARACARGRAGRGEPARHRSCPPWTRSRPLQTRRVTRPRSSVRPPPGNDRHGRRRRGQADRREAHRSGPRRRHDRRGREARDPRTAPHRPARPG